MAWTEAKLIAEAILDGFDRHYRLFREITAGAKQRFEAADWQAVQAKAQERIGFYDRRVGETVAVLRREFHLRDRNDFLWRRVKVEYLRLLPQHHQPELAETYYNSVFCRLFDRHYYHNDNIFVWPALSTEHLEAEVPIFRCYYPARDGFATVICAILDSFDFRVPFRDRRHDLRNLLHAIRSPLPARTRNATRTSRSPYSAPPSIATRGPTSSARPSMAPIRSPSSSRSSTTSRAGSTATPCSPARTRSPTSSASPGPTSWWTPRPPPPWWTSCGPSCRARARPSSIPPSGCRSSARRSSTAISSSTCAIPATPSPWPRASPAW